MVYITVNDWKKTWIKKIDYLVFQYLTIPYHPGNGKQIAAILKTLNRKPEYKIKTFLKKILNGKIPLNDAQYRKLSKHKNFIRSLSSEKFKLRNLMRNYNALGEIIDLMLSFSRNESYTKNDTSTFQGVEEIKSSKYYQRKGKNVIKINREESKKKKKKQIIPVKKISLKANHSQKPPTPMEKKKWKKKLTVTPSHLNVMKKEKKKLRTEKKSMKGKGNETVTETLNLTHVPDKIKPIVSSLLSLIRNKKIFKWNNKGEIIKETKPIVGSNIMKLIIHSLTKMKKKPVGYKFYYNEIKKFKIPYFLKINNLRKYTDINDDTTWRPPGILYKEKYS